MSRKCARSACPSPATATLSYSYADGVVWLEDLLPEAHPMLHDMCEHHASSLSVPLGWNLRDERSVRHNEDFPNRVSHMDLIGA
ncbi:MAG TPA: DUF3499 family protein [Microthrixaceae bacterium]|nr:DUF3499 family protein [Microthrixaceae bacterium]